DEVRLDEVAADGAREEDVVEHADEAEAEGVAQGERQVEGADEEVPADELERRAADDQHGDGGEGEQVGGLFEEVLDPRGDEPAAGRKLPAAPVRRVDTRGRDY